MRPLNIGVWGVGRDYMNELTVRGETGTAIASPAYPKPERLPVRPGVRRQNGGVPVALPDCGQMAGMAAGFAASAEDQALRRELRDEVLAQQKLLDYAKAAAFADMN